MSAVDTAWTAAYEAAAVAAAKERAANRNVKPGDTVSFIYNAGGHGTCLATGIVLEVLPRPVTQQGEPYSYPRVVVDAPADCVTAVDGKHTISACPDFVTVKAVA